MIDMPTHNRWLTPLLAVLFVVCLFFYWTGASLAALLTPHCSDIPALARCAQPHVWVGAALGGAGVCVIIGLAQFVGWLGRRRAA